MGALFVVLTALIQRYHAAWVASVELGLRALVRFVKWSMGKAPLRAEPEKDLRTKDNSVIEDAKEFFRQCAIPFVYAWESLAISWLRVVDEWHDFRQWSKDPVDTSTHPQTRQKHALPHYHRALSNQRDPVPVNDSIAAKMHLTPSGSSLDGRDEHADLPAREQTPHTLSRWHPSPLPPGVDAGDVSPIVEHEPPMSDSYPLEPELSYLVALNVPPLPPKSLARRSTDGLPNRVVRQEAPRRGSENQLRPDTSPGPSTSWLHDL